MTWCFEGWWVPAPAPEQATGEMRVGLLVHSLGLYPAILITSWHSLVLVFIFHTYLFWYNRHCSDLTTVCILYSSILVRQFVRLVCCTLVFSSCILCMYTHFNIYWNKDIMCLTYIWPSFFFRHCLFQKLYLKSAWILEAFSALKFLACMLTNPYSAAPWLFYFIFLFSTSFASVGGSFL